MDKALAAGRGQIPSDLLSGAADRIFMGERPVEGGNKREPKGTAERDRLLEEKR